MNVEPFDDDHDDDASASQLHDLLMAVRVPQTRVDLTSAISRARRQRRMSHVAAGLAVVLAASGAAAYAKTDPMRAGPTDEAAGGPIPTARCSMKQMNGPNDNPGWTLLGMDHTGGYVLGSVVAPVTASQPTGTASWLWDGVAWRPTAGLPASPTAFGGPDALAGDIPDPLQPLAAMRSWVHRDGTTSELTPPPGYASINILAVNARGDVLGIVGRTNTDDGSSVGRADRSLALWPASAPGTVRLLSSDDDSLVSNNARTQSLGEDGTVIGTVNHRPVVWRPDGTRADLPLPKGTFTGAALAMRGEYAYGVLGDHMDQLLAAWDLKTGKVHTVRLETTKTLLEVVGTTNGRVLEYALPGSPVLVDVAHARRVKLPLTGDFQSGTPVVRTAFISDNGKTTIAAVSMPQGGERVFAWHC